MHPDGGDSLGKELHMYCFSGIPSSKVGDERKINGFACSKIYLYKWFFLPFFFFKIFSFCSWSFFGYMWFILLCSWYVLRFAHHAVPFRNRERITFDYLVSMKKPDETAVLKVLRDGEESEFSITLRPVSHFASILCLRPIVAWSYINR